MTDQSQRLEVATVKAEVGSNILYRFSNDPAANAEIPTQGGDIPNLKQVILQLQEDGAEKISFATTIYPTTAAGIAATSSGAVFLVVSNEADEIYAVYTNTGGVAVDTGKRALSSQAVQDAMQAATEAADAAQEAADLSTERTARFLAPISAPPVIRDDGTPLKIGDRYVNTEDQAEYIYHSSGWQANESQVAILDLRDVTDTSKGAALVGWDDSTVGEHLNNSKTLRSYDELRAYKGPAVRIEITQRDITGAFSRRPSVAGDTDNGGTRILSESGIYIWEREYYGEVNICWFATVPVGGNDTEGLENALKQVFARNETLIIDRDIYTNRITIVSGVGAVVCTTGTIFAHADTAVINIYDNMLLQFSAGVRNSKFDLRMDMQGKGISGVFVKGSNNRICVNARNAIASDGQTYGIRALGVSGDYCEVPFTRCVNFVSVPTQGDGASAVTCSGYAKSVQIGKIIAEGGSGALLNNGRGTTVESIFVDGCLDNAVYDIEGAIDLHIGTIRAMNCPDEVLVFNRSVRGRAERVIAINCGRGVGVTNAVNPSVGAIHWRVDADSTIESGSPLFSRPNQTEQTNSLTVDKLEIRGTWKAGAPLFSFQHLGVKNVTIGELNADITYTSAAATKSLSFFDSLGSTIDIGELSVVVRDGLGTLTSSDVFTLNIVPTTPLAAYSAIGGFRLSNAGGLLSIRAPRVNDPNLVINDIVRIRSDIGTPYATNEDDQARVRHFYSGSVPTTGSWLRGDIVWMVTPGAGGYAGWECIASGAPGTWKRFGPIES